jgi:hypothetical protein
MQETLAPALGFLSTDGHDGRSWEFPATGKSRGPGRQPMLTLEALHIAEQAAAGLAGQSQTRSVRLKRLARCGLGYAAVFAAGVLLAVTLFKANDPAMVPDRKCTRNEAGRIDTERSAGEIRALALSCAVCHGGSRTSIDQHSTSLEAGGSDALDWFRPLLADERLLALRDRAVGATAA